MMSKKIYKAVFSDGDEITRTTARNYTHAWRVRNDEFAQYGFSGSYKLANTAASSLQCRKWNAKMEVVSCELQS
jgi:hypothetical protein